jgi:hypothetical protein
LERRLSAILAADVAGYSRLMSMDEEGTHTQLKGHLQALVDPKIEEHRGRIVKNTRDGMLVEFASVVDAVRCAVEVQRGMSERNARVSVDKRIEFRVGINLGRLIGSTNFNARPRRLNARLATSTSWEMSMCASCSRKCRCRRLSCMCVTILWSRSMRAVKWRLGSPMLVS